jgi:hypothetical protein
MRKFAQTLILSVGLFSVSPAQAQGVFDLGALTNSVAKTSETQATSGKTAAPISAAAIASFNYTPSMERHAANKKKWLDGLKQLNPEVGAQFETGLANVDLVEEVGKAIAPLGLRTDNLADAYAIYFISAWMGANGRTDTNTKEQVAGVQKIAQSALASTPAATKLTDAQKQEMAEGFIIQTAMNELMLQAATDPAAMTKVKAEIKAGAKEMGIDTDMFTLTPTGLARK